MNKEENRSYWKTLVDVQRQIVLPASIFRSPGMIKPQFQHLRIRPLAAPSPQFQPASCPHNIMK